MPAVNFKKLALANSEDAFLAACESIQRRGESVQLDIHLYLVSVATAWAAMGDVRPAVKRVNMLLDHLPKGVRSNAIKEWVETHLHLTWGDAKEGFVAGTAKHTDLNIKTIANVRWWEFKPEAEYKGMDFRASVLSLVKNADKRIAKPNDADKIEADILRAVRFAAGGKALGVAEIIDAIRSLDAAGMAEVLLATAPAGEEANVATA